MKRLWKSSGRQFLHTLDRFFFAVVCATAFTMALCHWLLDINYKYTTDMTGLNIDASYVFYVCAIASVYLIFRKGQVYFDFALVMLLQVMVFVGVQDYHNEDYVPVCYAWIIPIAYIIGKLAVGWDKKEINKKIVILYVSMAAGSYILSILDFGMNWVTGWEYGTEHWVEFWTQVTEARTTYEMGFILTTSACAFAVINFKRHKAAAIIVVAANIVAQYILVHAQGRQNPLMLVISIILVFGLYLYDNWGSLGGGFKKGLKYAVIAMALFIILFSVAFAINLFGIRDIYNASYWAAGGLLHNERIDIDIAAFKSMLLCPLDDFQERYGWDRGHSMVLEYGRVYDMTTYIMISLVRVLFIIDALKLALRRGKDTWIKYLIVPAFVCVNIYYTLEPNAHAHRYLWMMGLFISGMVRGWLELHDKRDVLEKPAAAYTGENLRVFLRTADDILQ